MLAATKTTCPYPKDNPQVWRQKGWFTLLGSSPPPDTHFVEVLISKTSYVGIFHTITCNYENSAHQSYSLMLLDRIQIGEAGPWREIYRGGVRFDHCVFSLTNCFFYTF